MAEPEQAEHVVSSGAPTGEDFEILLAAARTGSQASSPGVREVARRFWLQWLAGEGLLTCPYCGAEFATTEEYDEHEKWEC